MAKIKDKRLIKKITPDYRIRTDPTKVESFGVYNFSGTLLIKFNNYCFEKGLNRNEVITQTGFLIQELHHDPSLYGRAFRNAETIEKASKIFHKFIVNKKGEDRTTDLAYEFMDRNNT